MTQSMLVYGETVREVEDRMYQIERDCGERFEGKSLVFPSNEPSLPRYVGQVVYQMKKEPIYSVAFQRVI